MMRIILAALSVLLCVVSASAETLKDTAPHVSVTGEASECALPDRAILFLDIAAENPTATEAVSDNARRLRSVTDDLVRRGIAKESIHAEAATLAAVATEAPAPRGGHGKRAVNGFRVRSGLRVSLDSLDAVQALLPLIVDAGASEARAVQFVVADETARLRRLRIAALEDAQEQAKAYVEAAGAKLGRLIELEPQDATSRETYCEQQAPEPASATLRLPLRPKARRLTAKVAATWTISR
jgi:uncharacterized protein